MSLLICVGIVLDALSKILTQIYLAEQSIVLIPGFLSLEYVRNSGIAFSLPLTGILLKIITMILIFVIIVYYIHEERVKKSRFLDIGFALILSGALGNAWERIFIGSVTDMIAVERFAIFNLADSLIFLGACVLIYTYFIKKYPNF
ncbi:signal peptidase II [Candidatus Gracilibacteria bacterium]|nr:signal peptidase II [Candidatus Gracilibacteria bacterium]